jgi:pyridoxal 5'-phosphate synthase pdxT subunit
MRIGVLALQGDFLEHQLMLKNLGVEVIQVRLPDHLAGLHGLIIPGGESTTIGKLARDYGLIEPIIRFGKERAIWGTCAGAIMLAKDIQPDQPILGLMDIRVSRNAFGRQVDSFEISLDVPFLKKAGLNGKSFRAVFIRAPIIQNVYGKAEVMLTLEDGSIVAARQNHLLATSFHPELSGDERFHRYFVELVKSQSER